MAGSCSGIVTVVAPQVTAPVTSVNLVYQNQIQSEASPTGYMDIVNVTITTGAGSGSQPTISISINGVVEAQLSRPISGEVNFQVEVPSTGASYQICADSVCQSYTSQQPPCIPNWQCEPGQTGYETDGCGNRQANSACNPPSPPPNVTAPVTSVSIAYQSQSPSEASSSGYMDMINVTITTGAGSGSQPNINVLINGSQVVSLSRPVNGSTSIQLEVPSTGATYSVCADSTCSSYTSLTPPTPPPTQCYRGAIIYYGTISQSPVGEPYWTKNVGGSGTNGYPSLSDAQAYIDAMIALGYTYNQC